MAVISEEPHDHPSRVTEPGPRQWLFRSAWSKKMVVTEGEGAGGMVTEVTAKDRQPVAVTSETSEVQCAL